MIFSVDKSIYVNITNTRDPNRKLVNNINKLKSDTKLKLNINKSKILNYNDDTFEILKLIIQ